MLYEEFLDLSGLVVSIQYYEDEIQPEYASGDLEKQQFCLDWVKKNKQIICRAVSSDIRALSQTACMKDMLKSEKQRLKDALSDANGDKMELVAKIEKLECVIEVARKDIENLESVVKARNDCYDRLGAAENSLRVKDNEIMKLKAMLFDRMMETA